MQQMENSYNLINNFVLNPNGIKSGVNSDIFDNLMHETLYELYVLIVNNEVTNKIVIETNTGDRDL